MPAPSSIRTSKPRTDLDLSHEGECMTRHRWCSACRLALALSLMLGGCAALPPGVLSTSPLQFQNGRLVDAPAGLPAAAHVAGVPFFFGRQPLLRPGFAGIRPGVQWCTDLAAAVDSAGFHSRSRGQPAVRSAWSVTPRRAYRRRSSAQAWGAVCSGCRGFSGRGAAEGGFGCAGLALCRFD